MLVLSRRSGEKIHIGGNIVVTVIHSASGRVRLGIEAPREIAIEREEVHDRKLCVPALLSAQVLLAEPAESLC